MKKFVVIGGLLPFIVVMAIACQKVIKGKKDTSLSYIDSSVEKSKE